MRFRIAHGVVVAVACRAALGVDAKALCLDDLAGEAGDEVVLLQQDSTVHMMQLQASASGAASRRSLAASGGRQQAPLAAKRSVATAASSPAHTRSVDDADVHTTKPEHKRIIHARQKWIFAVFAVPVAVCVGIACCVYLQRPEDQDKMLAVGCEVTVRETFKSGNDPCEILPTGSQGIVEEIDEQGDVLIKFNDIATSQWVIQPDVEKLDVANEGS